MEKNIRYSIEVDSKFHIENFLGNNNNTNHSFFWMEDHDHGGRQFFFTSSLISDMTSSTEIIYTASQIIAIFQGIYTLLDRNRNGSNYFTIRNIYDIDSKRFLEKVQSTEIYKIDVDFSVIVDSDENKPSNPIYILFEQICKNPFLTNLFFLLSNKVDYRMLYIIYDDIRYYLKTIDDKTFLTPYKTPLNDFTHTANNYEVLGFYARHGRTGHQPPSSPMSLENSKNLIFDIIGSLINSKFNITLPEFWGMLYVDFSSVDLTQLQDVLKNSKS
ncbi:hypothetical protein [Flavobacterium fluviale]|nr:hypothetical protein [Flavobacterium fluviale]